MAGKMNSLMLFFIFVSGVLPVTGETVCAIYAGRSAGEIEIGMETGKALGLARAPAVSKVVEGNEKRFFMDVLKIKGVKGPLYDRLYYIQESGLVVISCRGRVAGIAVVSGKGLLEGAVSADRGIEPVLVFYGKEGRHVVKNGSHRGYFYLKRGIAFFDDDANGNVDMIVVWKSF